VRRVAVSVLAILTVAAVIASLVAFSALGESRRRYAESLATQARARADSDPRTAIALAAESMVRTGSDPADARAALVAASDALAARFVPAGPPLLVGDASTVVVSPDGSVIVTGNRDGSISTWSETGMSLAADVPGHEKAIEEMDFTPDGRSLLSVGDDSAVLLWDLSDPSDIPAPSELGTTSGAPAWSVTVSPDGATAASASEDGSIDLWDLQSQTPIDRTDLAFDTITASFSPDGDLLMIGNGLGEVTGLAADDLAIVVPTFQAHGSDVWEIEFTEDGSRFATVSSDGRVRVWDAETTELLDEPFARTAFVAQGGLVIGDAVVAGDEQGRLLEAPLDGSAPPKASSTGSAPVVDAAWGGETLATLGADQRVQLWSPGGEPTALALERQPGGAFGVAASPDGSRLAVGDGEGAVRVYSTATGEMELGPLGLHEGRVADVAFSEDGARIASGGDDGTVSVIDAASGQPIGGPQSGGAAVTAVLWADERLVTGDEGGSVRVWTGGTLDAELGPHTGAVTAMSRAPDGTLAVADASGQVSFWDLDGERAAEPIAADDTAVWGVDWSRDGSILAAASDDGEVSLWDAASRTRVGVLTPQPGGAAGVAFLDDGDSIATTSRDGVVRVWDVASAAPLGGELQGHQDAAWGAVALPDARFATTSADGTVLVWDVLNLERACERAAGTLGLDALGPYLGDEQPIACTAAVTGGAG
jgi:WD40 repeat protein